ncbi:hypothetical protein [Halobaculum sp. D14]|uniref:hypothetical protein n=1 Tax=Halobaculum sp. D14 TaxID=3421642 RepID=UPI003EBD22B5
MSSTTSQRATRVVDRDADDNRVSLTLTGSFGAADVVEAMARARHVVERCRPGFGVVVDVRDCSWGDGALDALAEWEAVLRRAGACEVVRVGTGRAVENAAVAASDPEAAAQLLST